MAPASTDDPAPTPSSRPLDSEAPPAKQLLDNQPSVVFAVSRATRTRRNQLSGVLALPAEILLCIFELLQAMSPPALGMGRPLGWIAVTHVCQRWRFVAVDAPCLWRHISSGGLGHSWVELMLMRARAVPITIHWMLEKDAAEDQADLDLISKHLHHTRNLGLWGRAPILLCWLSLQSFSRTMLETLHLDGSHRYHANYTVPDLPETLVGAQVPSLKVVRLTGLCIPWTAPVLSGLVHLEVQMMQYDSPDASATSASYDNASYDDLLSALERMPTLHVLLLENCLPRRSPKATHNVDLPHLDRLFLLGPSKPCFDIFRQLKISPSCQLQLHCVDGEDTNPEAIEDVLPGLGAHLGAEHDAPPFQSLEISGPWAGQYHLDAWRSDIGAAGFRPARLADLSIHLPSAERPQASLAALCSARPFRGIRMISVEPEDSMTPLLPAEAWREILGQCTEVRQATLQGTDAITFCAALGAPFTAAGEKQDDFTLLNKLEQLRLEDVAFDAHGLVDGENTWYHTLFWERLAQRHEVPGLPRLSLSFMDCNLPSELVQALDGLDSVVFYWLQDQGFDEGSEADDDKS